jgi:hypothetical protein
MLDPALYQVMDNFHTNSALVLDLISPWVVGSLFYAGLENRDGLRIVSISGKDILWWGHLVIEEVWNLFEALGPNIVIEIEEFWEDNYGLYTQLPEGCLQYFLEKAPPAMTYRLINQEGVVDGQPVNPPDEEAVL